MKITYTSTNISHHYRYARELAKQEDLYAFITSASRFSPRSALPEARDALIRRDFFQNFYLAALRYGMPKWLTAKFEMSSIRSIDRAALQYARESDAFVFYRTTGYCTTKKLHKEESRTLCVMEEVNSHVDSCHSLMKEEYEKLGLGEYSSTFTDHALRLRTYEEADCILCPSEFVRRSFLERGFAEDRLLKVNFGFSFPQKETPKNKNDDTFRLVYVGQVNFRKGLRYAVEAFRKLKHPKKEFVIVGPKTKVTGLERTNIPDGVRFTGILKGGDLDNAYASATVFVLPTVEEGLALVLGEAMGAGLPIITTTNSGAEDIMTDGREGFILPPGDVESLGEALQRLADEPQLVQQMQENARMTAKTLGGWDVAAKRLVEVLNDKIRKG